ncbi:N-terminal acetyltransferase B complex auxiliary subunit NAA25 isoform X2 [Beta vulgaris subsp. vulgaris]|uniref:N-terminal acetyltransferase B complex auxiliary subunit NAA25 isoform X2 n=1 Tax=Beta vulgaris subsp. vulgaris TaxID=3555 RepID=UPI0020372DA4|nr:N-terminal acetyltransferase B complex auxiliary subunit NAA25 isoform X2 [Beta vulgaris subsp. vulgaris]
MSNPLAGKFGYAGGMPERKVRPVWDAIDTRQYKNALKLASSLLTKYPKQPYAMALKALILERMGKHEEALSICLEANELLHNNVTLLVDDLTLSTLQMVFQRLDRLDLATSLYDYACGRIPNNLDLMMGLFNCYVREYAYVKQQQTAIKMYKLAGEERFLLWAVCSIQLQVSCGQGGEKLLGLAEGLIKKHIAAHSLHEPEALIVYISVLEQQGKYEDALEVLSGELGSLIQIEVDRLRLQGRLLAHLGDNAAAASTFQKILESCPCDWECFLHYLGCLLEDDQSWHNGVTSEPRSPPKLVNKLPHLTDDVFNSRIQDASTFARKLHTEVNSDFKRGPSLAYLEIQRRKILHGIGDKEKLINALVHYFCSFGYLACFCSDIEVFLDFLTPDEKLSLLEKLKESSGSMCMLPTKSLGLAISLQRTQLHIGVTYKLSDAELESLAVKMVNMYRENLPLSKDLDPQESMHGEELLHMASNMLVQLYWRTGHVGYLLETIMMLELGLNIRRFVSQYKIILLHLYSHFGALPVAYEWYRTLDVKNILLETMSHQILPQMLLSPLWEDLDDLLDDYLTFMDNYLKDSADLTFLAYRHRNYSKVIEFVQFKERLQHSNQYLVARLESSILKLKEKADNLEEVEGVFDSLKCGTQVLELASDTLCKSLTFNEEFQLRPWWTPTPQKNYLLGPFEELNHPKENLDDRKEWETNVRDIVEKRYRLPRMVYLSVQCVSASIKENLEVNGSISNSSFSLEMKSLLEGYVKILGCSLNEAVKVVLDVAEGQRSLEALGSELIEWVNFAVFLNAWSSSSHESVLPVGGESTSLWHAVNSLLNKCITEKVKITRPMVWSPGGNLPVLMQLIGEPVAWHSLVLQSYVRSSLPCGKKKKKSGPADSSTSIICQTIRDSVSSLHSIVEMVVNWLNEEVKKEDEAMDQLLSSLTRGPNEGPGQVFQALKDIVSAADEGALGDRIFQSIKSWSPADVARMTVNGQHKVMLDFLQICESKLKMLKALKQQI